MGDVQLGEDKGSTIEGKGMEVFAHDVIWGTITSIKVGRPEVEKGMLNVNKRYNVNLVIVLDGRLVHATMNEAGRICSLVLWKLRITCTIVARQRQNHIGKLHNFCMSNIAQI